MLPSRCLLTAALTVSALAQNDQGDGGSAPYKICPTKEYSEPYCCTHLISGMGIGCRVRKNKPANPMKPTMCFAFIIPHVTSHRL